jgi:hypothetical protein
MLKAFILKDENGNEVIAPINEVLYGTKFDSILRYPKSYLRFVADERPWDGKPHVTDLINGPRYVFLKHTTDYSINPSSAAYRVMGINAHARLESNDEENEISLENEDVVGRSDVIEDNPDGTNTITDYKIVGSYKVALALGIYTESVPSLDENGNPIVIKSGAKKGLVKTHKEIRVDPKRADIKDWTRQLNIYRMLANQQGYNVTKLQIFVIVRDANTITSINRGVLNETYLIPLPVFSDRVVNDFVKQRSGELMEAFEKNETPRICNAEESWNGRRCKDFCEVAGACQQCGGPFVAEQEDSDEE